MLPMLGRLGGAAARARTLVQSRCMSSGLNFHLNEEQQVNCSRKKKILGGVGGER